eukprot:14327478-Ditylum_brightwellii.AAC.1
MDSFFFCQQDWENQEKSTSRIEMRNDKLTMNNMDKATQKKQHIQHNMIKSNDNCTNVDIDK